MGGGAKVAVNEDAQVTDSTDWFNGRTGDSFNKVSHLSWNILFLSAIPTVTLAGWLVGGKSCQCVCPRYK